MNAIATPMVVFGEDWGRHPSSTQHLISSLMHRREVLWVNSIGMRRPRLNRSDLGRVGAKLASSLRCRESQATRAAQEQQPANVVTARAISWPGSRVADSLNRKLIPASLEEHLSKLSSTSPIVWSSLPTAAPVVDRLGNGSVVYYAGDDFSALAGVDHKAVCEMEKDLVRRADLVIAASDVIADRLPSNRTRVLPHGCDIALFSSPSPRAPDMPADRPVAGFYGSISSWIDVELLAKTAALLPDWCFMILGETRCDVRCLAAQPNVILAGQRQHHELPGYSQHWQVSLLPFRDNRQIAACNPLKLREYLAAGSPVIASVDFAALSPYRDQVTIAEGAQDLARVIAENVETTPDARQRRREAVAGESWQARSATVETWLSQLA